MECHFSMKNRRSPSTACISKLPCSVNHGIIGCRRSQNSVYSIQFLSQVPTAFFSPFSAVCVVVLWSCWPSPCVFTFGLWSQLCDQRGTKYKLNSNHSQAALWSWPFRQSPSQLPGSAADPRLHRSLGTWHSIKLPPECTNRPQKDKSTSEKASGGLKTSRRVQAQRKHWKGTDCQCLGGVLFIFSVKVKFSLVL